MTDVREFLVTTQHKLKLIKGKADELAFIYLTSFPKSPLPVRMVLCWHIATTSHVQGLNFVCSSRRPRTQARAADHVTAQGEVMQVEYTKNVEVARDISGD